MILAVMNAIFAIAYGSLKNSGVQQDLNLGPHNTGVMVKLPVSRGQGFKPC